MIYSEEPIRLARVDGADGTADQGISNIALVRRCQRYRPCAHRQRRDRARKLFSEALAAFVGEGLAAFGLVAVPAARRSGKDASHSLRAWFGRLTVRRR
jgi:hypothetical protein